MPVDDLAMISSILVFVVFVSEVDVLENGLARTPPMGWMSWGYYMCNVDCEKFPHKCLNEQLILSVADTFFEEGYQEAGFEYIIIDDCWSEMERDADGRLVPDRKRFPNGMKYIADYLHAKRLKFGMYTNVAEVTCMKYPGSKNYFKIDAQTFSEWGVDYLKVDGCFVKEADLNTAGFQSDIRALLMWRNFHDISSNWGHMRYTIRYFENEYENIHQYHGPGQWNDPDMLLFGGELLSPEQSRSLISVFAMWSAPILLSCDMTKILDFEKKLLLNLDLMAVAQDPLGIMAKPYKLGREISLWVKPHLPKKGDSYPSFSFLLLNLDDYDDVSVSFTPSVYGLNSTDGYTMLDIFTGEFLRNITLHDSLTITINSDDSVFYTMYPL